MEFGLNISLCQSLQFPIRIRELGGLPKIIAGGVPVTPINLVLKQRQRQLGATSASLDTYVRAARLYVEFCAYRGQSLLGVTNEEFYWFKHALLGHPFPDLSGMYVRLSGERKERTADLMIVLLYSLATDIADRYDISFDWLRYKGEAGPHFNVDAPHRFQAPIYPQASHLRRAHRLKYTSLKVVGLPDEQFVRMLVAAHERWMQTIADGDIAYSTHPDSQRGALFWRNWCHPSGPSVHRESAFGGCSTPIGRSRQGEVSHVCCHEKA